MLSPLQNLQAFAVAKPPVVIFTGCIAIFAVASLSLSYYLRSGPIRNPDVALDWNAMMDRISKWDMCVMTTAHIHKKPGTVAREVERQEKELRDLMGLVKNSVLLDNSNNNSVSVRLQLKLSSQVQQLPNNVDVLMANVSLRDIGFTGAGINEKILVAMDLTEKHRFVNCTVGGYCTVVPDVCVTFIGPAHDLLPQTKRSNTCLVRPSKHNIATFSFLTYDESKSDGKNGLPNSCAGLVISPDFVDDPSLEELLNYNEQTLMNLHLTYTGYFLFVMVITVVCYALVRGQTSKPKMISIEKAASV